MTQGLYRTIRSTLPAVPLLLAACASNPPAPVEDRSTGDSRPPAPAGVSPAAPAAARGEERHIVARGDTLYAIAFRRGVDFRDLANWNGIAPPYRIFVGQELRLSAPPNAPARTAPVAAAAPSAGPERVATVTTSSAPPPPAQNPPVEKSTKTQPSMFEDVGAPPPRQAQVQPAEAVPTAPTPAPPAAAPVAAAAPPAAAAAPAAAVAPAAQKSATSAERPPEHVAELNAGGVSWRWPGEGKVTGTFVAGDQIRQGIDIAGKAGDAVRAAADGEVVYSGNGLLGYGELIIIKHNANFLSAYGHNRQRLVKEGDRVKAGQQIAELGSSASSREELHFEIRKNGKPVNPLDYLPVR